MNEKLLGGIFCMGVLRGERVEREVNDRSKRGDIGKSAVRS